MITCMITTIVGYVIVILIIILAEARVSLALVYGYDVSLIRLIAITPGAF